MLNEDEHGIQPDNGQAYTTCFDAIKVPDLATEITLQPVRRYGVDAAILYSDIVVPVHAVGFGVSEMSGEFALALEMGATLTDIADTIHAHPTLTEAVQESTQKALGRALHI